MSMPDKLGDIFTKIEQGYIRGLHLEGQGEYSEAIVSVCSAIESCYNFNYAIIKFFCATEKPIDTREKSELKKLFFRVQGIKDSLCDLLERAASELTDSGGYPSEQAIEATLSVRNKENECNNFLESLGKEMSGS